jgi:hypothetical protein
MHTESYYKKLREKYTPHEIKLIFIFESPPTNGTYFYDDTGPVNEPLFKGMMKCFIPFVPAAKEEGLTEFCKRGFLVVDAVYVPIDNIRSSNERETVIQKHYKKLENDLRSLIKNRAVRIILVGAAVSKALEEKLKEKFYVINDGEVVPFNGNGQQNNFRSKIRYLFNLHNVDLDLYC